MHTIRKVNFDTTSFVSVLERNHLTLRYMRACESCIKVALIKNLSISNSHLAKLDCTVAFKSRRGPLNELQLTQICFVCYFQSPESREGVSVVYVVPSASWAFLDSLRYLE